MNVERIYTRDVVRAPRSTSIGQAAELMRRHNVGLLLVTEESPQEYQAIGVVTDRDLVVGPLAEGLGPDEAQLGEVMTQRLGTIEAGADLHEALDVMRQGGFRRLAVTDSDSRIVGVLSVDDVIDGIAADLSNLARVMRTARGPEQAAV